MERHIDLNAFTDEIFGLYVPSSNWECFNEFADALESLCEFRMMSRTAVEFAISTLPQSMEREIANLRQAEASGDDVFVDAATYDQWDERLARAPEDFRTFIYTGITAGLFASLESLLDSMVDVAAGEVNATVEYEDKPMPNIDKRLRFLQRVCGMTVPLTKEQRRQLDVIRDMRNRLVHSLGRGLSDDLKQRLNELIAAAEEQDFVVDDRFVRSALVIVAGITASLEAAFEDRFGPG